MYHTPGNHRETNDRNYKHVNATAELIMHLTDSAEPRLGNIITRNGSEILLDPSSLKNEYTTTIKLSENMECSGLKVNTPYISKGKTQKEQNIDNMNERKMDELDCMADDSVVQAKDEIQKQIADQINEVRVVDAKGIRNSLEISTKHTSKPNMESISAKRQIKMYSKLDEDKYACKIVGMCTTKKGLVLLADLNNNKLKIFTTTNIPLSCITIPRGPLSVTLMDEVTALVGRQDKNIEVIDIADAKSMKVIETIKLAYKIMGITSSCGNIVVTTLDEPKGVKMLKLNGKEVWSITTDLQGRQMFEAPEYIISYGMENETIVVSDYRKETLSFISGKTGTILKTLAVQGIGPEGIAVDDFNNLFVASFDRNEISCISENDGKIQTVLSWKNWRETLLETFARIRYINCCEGPLALSYNCFTKELFLSYSPSDFVDRFTLTHG